MTQPSPTDQVDATAARWYARMNGAPGESDRQAFAAWLAAAEVHRRAWDQVRAVEALMGQVGPSPETRRLVSEALATQPVPRRRVGWGIAAAMALAVGGGALWWDRIPAEQPQIVYQTYDNGPGKPRQIDLADGSRITLDGRSRLRVALGGAERRVDLVSGRAFFRVAKDKTHPFVVSSAGSTITALGTAFDVRTDAGHTVATLVEGRIRVDMPAQGRSATLTPGMRIAIRPDSVIESHLSAERATEWMLGRITYEDAPLGEVVAEVNRHAAQCLTLASPDLAQRRISGLLQIDDGRSMAEALVAYRIVRIDPADAADGCIHLKAY